MRRTQEAMIGSVVNAIDAAGGEVEYTTLHQALTASGDADAIGQLRSMKQSEIITMSLERDDSGQLRHVVRNHPGVTG